MTVTHQQEQEQATSGLEVDNMADSKKYDGSQWEHSLRKLTTATEAVENPLYSDGTAITAYTIKGNTVQSGTPTPSNPVPVVGVGELETTGEHSGEYKIPISNGQQTTNNNLGSTQTVRQIKKRVFDGTENWQGSDTSPTKNLTIEGYAKISGISCESTHYNPANNVDSGDPIPYDSCCFYIGASNVVYLKGNESSSYPKTIADFKAYLAQQYANGTPVTIWYVLATEETAAVNEPLMKIGTYADTLSNATAIPTTEGANSITVDTAVQPSEFTATWIGWHNSTVKEYDGANWN